MSRELFDCSNWCDIRQRAALYMILLWWANSIEHRHLTNTVYYSIFHSLLYSVMLIAWKLLFIHVFNYLTSLICCDFDTTQMHKYTVHITLINLLLTLNANERSTFWGLKWWKCQPNSSTQILNDSEMRAHKFNWNERRTL